MPIRFQTTVPNPCHTRGSGLASSPRSTTAPVSDHSSIPGIPGIDPALLETLIAEHESTRVPRLGRLWDYYRNTASSALTSEGRPTQQLAQHQGLPPRLTGARNGESASHTPREVVIENDIAWRIHTLVDFMFGKPVALQSLAADAPRGRGRGRVIESFLRRVIDHAGGPAFFQTLGLLGSVYGYVDVLLRVEPALFDRAALGLSGDGISVGDATESDHASHFVLEIIEPTRAVPLLCPQDYRRLDAFAIHGWQWLHQVEQPGVLGRLMQSFRGLRGGNYGGNSGGTRSAIQRTEVWTDESVTRLEWSHESRRGQRVEVDRQINPLGVLPIVHIQNLAQPFAFEGLSEVEPLIPLQDELNTRLSDRANRVTFQAFKMYLGKGIEGFLDRPVGPGQMWATDNLDAHIEAFGGDSHTPSEDAHIREIREALDKTSAVTSVAAGLLRDKVGNVASENALRIALVGLLARTQQKRVTYAAGIARLCELVLHAADVTGILRTAPHERAIRLDWPSPLPEDMTDRLRDAQIKIALGVPRTQVLTELGYPPTEQV